MPLSDALARLLDVDRAPGTRMTSAPPAMPLITAIQPVWRPITSTTMTRLCDSAVVCSRSIASVAIEDRGVEAERVVGRRRGRCRSSSGRRRPAADAPHGGAPRRRVCPRRRSRRVRRALRREVLEHALDAALELVRVRAASCRGSCRRGGGSPTSARRRAARSSPRRARASPRARRRPRSPRSSDRRVTARMTAFSPGQSPPPVRMRRACSFLTSARTSRLFGRTQPHRWADYDRSEEVTTDAEGGDRTRTGQSPTGF